MNVLTKPNTAQATMIQTTLTEKQNDARNAQTMTVMDSCPPSLRTVRNS